jgi:hypothetical protein
VLEHLVCVDDIKRAIIEGQVVCIAFLEADIGLALRFLPGGGQHITGSVYPDYLARWDPRREPDGDRAGAAADIENPRRGRQPRQQVPG